MFFKTVNVLSGQIFNDDSSTLTPINTSLTSIFEWIFHSSHSFIFNGVSALICHLETKLSHSSSRPSQFSRLFTSTSSVISAIVSKYVESVCWHNIFRSHRDHLELYCRWSSCGNFEKHGFGAILSSLDNLSHKFADCTSSSPSRFSKIFRGALELIESNAFTNRKTFSCTFRYNTRPSRSSTLFFRIHLFQPISSLSYQSFLYNCYTNIKSISQQISSSFWKSPTLSAPRVSVWTLHAFAREEVHTDWIGLLINFCSCWGTRGSSVL